MIHPTAATPELHNKYAAPFAFLVLRLPKDFRQWLVTVGIHEVESHLGLLFVENGTPIPHDYAMTLTNYSLRTDTDYLRDVAHQRVRHSVINQLFDKPSDTSRRTIDFVHKFRDNLDGALTNEAALNLVRESTRVTSLDVTVPNVGVTMTVYNVYIHPPTAEPGLIGRWRKWLSS